MVTLVVLAAGVGERFGGLKQLAPVGPGGESLMDYSIKGAQAAGCERVVTVVRSELEAPIRAHLREVWSDRLTFEFVEQPVDPAGKPGGTALAVLACRSAVGDDAFVAINADDLYLPPVLAVLHRWLSGSGASHALVGFPLGLTMLPGSGPVTRALCSRHADGSLDDLIESKVERRGEGFVGRPLRSGHHRVLGASQLVSMNAWGFRPSIWSVLEPAVAALQAAQPAGDEVFLPVALSGTTDIAVLPVDVPCFGVTWPDDLEALQKRVHGLIESGVYPAQL